MLLIRRVRVLARPPSIVKVVKEALIEPWENHPSGAEAHFSPVITARLEAVPFQNRGLISAF